MKRYLLKDPKVDDGATGMREGVDDGNEGGGPGHVLSPPSSASLDPPFLGRPVGSGPNTRIGFYF